MAEPFFQFKRFRVYHSACGFKVGTDGVLLGAWANVSDGHSVLDIGTGSGLIALMLAQRAKVSIDAIELHPCAAKQAEQNVARSAFGDVLVYNNSLAVWADSGKKYDVVVCNPPFFSNAQPPKDDALALAKHTITLTPMELFGQVRKLMKPTGHFCTIFPKTEYELFCHAAKTHGFFPEKVVDVYPMPNYPEIRLMVEFTLTDKGKPTREPLYIEQSESRHDYSDAYKALTKDFFLRF